MTLELLVAVQAVTLCVLGFRLFLLTRRVESLERTRERLRTAADRVIEHESRP